MDCPAPGFCRKVSRLLFVGFVGSSEFIQHILTAEGQPVLIGGTVVVLGDGAGHKVHSRIHHEGIEFAGQVIVGRGLEADRVVQNGPGFTRFDLVIEVFEHIGVIVAPDVGGKGQDLADIAAGSIEHFAAAFIGQQGADAVDHFIVDAFQAEVDEILIFRGAQGIHEGEHAAEGRFILDGIVSEFGEHDQAVVTGGGADARLSTLFHSKGRKHTAVGVGIHLHQVILEAGNVIDDAEDHAVLAGLVFLLTVLGGEFIEVAVDDVIQQPAESF